MSVRTLPLCQYGRLPGDRRHACRFGGPIKNRFHRSNIVRVCVNVCVGSAPITRSHQFGSTSFVISKIHTANHNFDAPDTITVAEGVGSQCIRNIINSNMFTTSITHHQTFSLNIYAYDLSSIITNTMHKTGYMHHIRPQSANMIS